MSEMREAYDCAVRLLHAINERNWPGQEIVPLPDLIGVLTQVDHLTAHLTTTRAAIEAMRDPPDWVIDAAVKAHFTTNFQGFLYGNRHVLRDINKREDQTVWSLTSDDYDSAHAQMEMACDRFEMRAAFNGAIAALSQANSTTINPHSLLTSSVAANKPADGSTPASAGTNSQEQKP